MQSLARIRFSFIIVFGLFFITKTAFSDLDLSFGNNGKVITDFLGLTDVLSRLIIDDAGKILVGGSATKNIASDHLALARYNSDGTLDRSFDRDGKVTMRKIADNKFINDGVTGLAINADGKIIACSRGVFSNQTGFAVLRYDASGSLDEAFADQGSAFVSDKTDIYPLDLVLDDEQKIVVAASAFEEEEKSHFAIFRFNSDGTPDKSFGDSGKVLTKIAPGIDVPRAAKIDKNGKILVAGFSGYNNFVVVRYNTDGTLDNSFANNGIAIIYFNKNGIDTLHALIIQDDGKIVVGGDAQVGSFAGLRMVDFGLARLTADGQLDLSFNESGTQITYFDQPASSTLWALALQKDGKLIAIGDAAVSKSLAIARYNTDGSLDQSFGEQGKYLVSCPGTCHWEALSLQEDGKIVAGGYIWNGKHYDMALFRINP